MLPSVAIIGSGRMGRGIAATYAAAGRDVSLIDVKQRDADGYAMARDAADAEIVATLASMRKLGLLPVATDSGSVQHLTPSNMSMGLSEAEFIFEGVPETIDAKAAAFKAIARHIREDAVVASTSSSFVSTELAGLVPWPERFVNAHWLNPAYVVPLVEVSPHPGSSRAAVERLMDALREIGKVPVECGPLPGYIVPRLQTLIMNEVARMIEEGVATPEDIDLAVRCGFGIRYASMGVAEFIDFGGMDILHYASGYLVRTLDQRFGSPETVSRHIANSQRGVRDGQGLYDWREIDIEKYREQLLERLAARIRLMQTEGAHLRPTSPKGRHV